MESLLVALHEGGIYFTNITSSRSLTDTVSHEEDEGLFQTKHPIVVEEDEQMEAIPVVS